MIPIPGWLIALCTFPGVIVHEAAHMLFCKLGGVPVLDVCFLRMGNPVGYVVHEPIKDFHTSFLVCVGPLIVNSLLCIVLCFPAFIPVKIFGLDDAFSFFLIWLGVSIGMHAFPSGQDADNLWHEAREARGSRKVLAIASYPLVALVHFANFLRIFWLDYLYGVALGLLLPELLFKRLL